MDAGWNMHLYSGLFGWLTGIFVSALASLTVYSIKIKIEKQFAFTFLYFYFKTAKRFECL